MFYVIFTFLAEIFNKIKWLFKNDFEIKDQILILV